MENGYNNGNNNDYQFTRPQGGGPDYGGNMPNNYSNRGYNCQGMDATPMTMGEWLITLIILAIPCVNIIMCFVWGFGSTGNLNKRNFCRAYLIVLSVTIVLSVIFIMIMAGSVYTVLNSNYPMYYY